MSRLPSTPQLRKQIADRSSALDFVADGFPAELRRYALRRLEVRASGSPDGKQAVAVGLLDRWVESPASVWWSVSAADLFAFCSDFCICSEEPSTQSMRAG